MRVITCVSGSARSAEAHRCLVRVLQRQTTAPGARRSYAGGGLRKSSKERKACCVGMFHQENSPPPCGWSKGRQYSLNY